MNTLLVFCSISRWSIIGYIYNNLVIIMYNKQEVLASLDQDVWSPIAMEAVIASKAMKLSEKGQSLSMYALDLSPRDGVDEKMVSSN